MREAADQSSFHDSLTHDEFTIDKSFNLENFIKSKRLENLIAKDASAGAGGQDIYEFHKQNMYHGSYRNNGPRERSHDDSTQ